MYKRQVCVCVKEREREREQERERELGIEGKRKRGIPAVDIRKCYSK